MLMSALLGKRAKERPADAFFDSHAFLLRGGYVRQVGNGIFTMLLPAKRILLKIEKILREEMDLIGGQEVLFPVTLPAELLKESGRYESIGRELLRFKDRTGKDMCLGMTHEEAAVHLARQEAESYADFPFMIYQIQTKFRDEPRSRGGLIRVREFTMKDAYSFHTSQEDLERYYEEAFCAYVRIYKRAGLFNIVQVKSDSGIMGGKVAHEFMYLSEKGEDTLVTCENCQNTSNMEVAQCRIEKIKDEPHEIKKVHTPGVTDIKGLSELFKKPESSFIKSAVFSQYKNGKQSDKPLIVFIRGDYQINEAKVRAQTGCDIVPFTGEYDLRFGFIGPYLLSVEADILYDVSLEGAENMICGANEDDYHLTGISVERDLKISHFADLYKVSDSGICKNCGGALKIVHGIEVGNIFQLGTKYTESMNMTYMGKDGNREYPIMGCYGIGLGRMLACIAEEHHDDKGPIWPISVAPWQIHICVLGNNEGLVEQAKRIYNMLNLKYEVMLDDRSWHDGSGRSVSAGAAFADADLLGIPVRLVLSERNFKNNEIELRLRDGSMVKKVSEKDLAQEIEAAINYLSDYLS